MDDIYYGTENLPEQVNVSIREDEGWVTKDVNVSWDFSSLIPGAENTVTGTLEDANGLTITANVVDIPENLLYFIDSGATNGSELYDVIKEMAPNLVNTGRMTKPIPRVAGAIPAPMTTSHPRIRKARTPIPAVSGQRAARTSITSCR